jgi:hypothetical protein
MENYLKYIINKNENKINKGKLIVDVSLIMKMLLNKKKFVEKIGKLKNENITLREKTNLSNSNKNLVCNFLEENIINTQVIKVLLNGNKKI